MSFCMNNTTKKKMYDINFFNFRITTLSEYLIFNFRPPRCYNVILFCVNSTEQIKLSHSKIKNVKKFNSITYIKL